MASIIIFSTRWGIALKEWKGSSARTHVLIAGGLATLIASTIIIGWGNYLTAKESAPKQSAGLFRLDSPQRIGDIKAVAFGHA
jgi:L-rhamnose-H+ transport protein